MIDALKTWLREAGLAARESDTTQEGPVPLRLAAACLLVEMSRADGQMDPRERESIATLLRDRFALDAQQTEALLNHARQRTSEATSLYEFTGQLNRELNAEEKIRLVEQLWEVAFSDGHVDKYEEHLVRRVAELLYVPHREFVAARLAVARRHGREH